MGFRGDDDMMISIVLVRLMQNMMLSDSNNISHKHRKVAVKDSNLNEINISKENPLKSFTNTTLRYVVTICVLLQLYTMSKQ